MTWPSRSRPVSWAATFALLAIGGCTDPILRPLDSGLDDGGRDGQAARDARVDSEVDAAVDGGGDAGVACEASLRDCDGNPNNECETDVSDDPANCGGCGIQCIMGTPCEGGRCRNGGWADAWSCPTGDVRIRALSLDGQALIAMGHVPSTCSPLGQTPFGETDWAVARYVAETGLRDPSWVARYGSTEIDVALTGGTVDSRSVIGGICRGTVDFGNGPTNVGAVSGCLAEYTSDGVFRELYLITGNSSENIEAALPLAGGGALVAGTSRSLSIEVGDGCAPLVGTGGDAEIFVVRYASDGNCLWARRYPSAMPDDATGDEEVTSIAVDDAGNIYLAASTRGTVEFGITRASSAFDVSVLGLDPAGELRWEWILSSSGDDFAGPIAVADGSLFAAVQFGGSVEIGDETLMPADASDALLVRLNAATGRPEWVTWVEGESNERFRGLAYDPVRNQVVASGEFGFGSIDADVTVGTFSATSTGIDVLATLLDAATGEPIELMTFGGSLADRAEAVVVDPTGAVYMSGRFRGPTIFPDGVERDGATLAGGNDGFVLRWEPGDGR